MADAVTLSTPSKLLPTSRPLALQKHLNFQHKTKTARTAVAEQTFKVSSNIFNMMQGASVLVLSFRCQLVCRFRNTKLLISAAADLNLVIGFYLFSSPLRPGVYIAVRRQQQLATFCYLVSMFVLFRSVTGYILLLSSMFWFASLRILRAAGRRQFLTISKLPGKSTCSEPTRTVSWRWGSRLSPSTPLLLSASARTNLSAVLVR